MKRTRMPLFIMIFSALGCGNKEQEHRQNNQVKEVKSTTELSITPENLVEVENEFKIDLYAAAEKYAGKQITVEALCTGVDMTTTIIPYSDLEGYFTFFEYLKTNTYTKSMPAAVAKLRSLGLMTDLPPQKWQPNINFTDGRTLGYDLPLFEGDENEFYLIYDKKNDQIVFDNEIAQIIALYVRAHRATTESRQETIAHVDQYVKNKLLDNVYENLMAGNFYYYSENLDYKWTVDNSATGPESITLIPCKYTITGTVSKDILDKNIYLVNSKIVKTDWLIDKKKFFNKQILF